MSTSSAAARSSAHRSRRHRERQRQGTRCVLKKFERTKVREAIDRLKELRTALISAAVTGKIDVREEAA
jgi:hypothetical protein